MATSGVTSYSVSRDQVIKSSLRLLKVIGEGEDPSSTMLSDCVEALNIMVKSWVKRGAQLWKIRYLQIPMLAEIHVYPLGSTAGYVYSASVSNVGSGGTPGIYALTLTGGGGTGGAGTYTINASGVVSLITITAGGSAYTSAPILSFPLGGIIGASGTAVIAGVTGPRPLRIFEAYLHDNVSNQDIPLRLLSRNEYNTLGDKSSSSRVNQFYYDPQLQNGRLHVYPQPSSSDNVTIYATAQFPVEDLMNGVDEFDFPQEWFKVLKYGLASEIGPEFISDTNRLTWLTNIYMAELNQCFDWSNEEASVFFTVDMR